MNYENLSTYKGDGKSLKYEIVSFILTFIFAIGLIRLPYLIIRKKSADFPANYSYGL